MGLLFWVSRDQRCLWSGCPELLSLRNYLKEFSRKNILQVVSFFLHDVAVMLRAIVRDHLQPCPQFARNCFPWEIISSIQCHAAFWKNRRCAHKDQSFGFTWSIPVVWSSPCSCHSGRVLIVASLRPAVRTKKRLPNKQSSKFRGTRNLEQRCFCRRKNIRVDNFTNVFGWRRRTSSILNRSCGYRPTWDKGLTFEEKHDNG